MKKLLVIALLSLSFTCYTSFAQAAPKFGTVNTQEVFTIMPEKIEVEKKLEALSKRYEDELMKMQEEFQKKYKDFIAAQDSIPENIKVRRMQEVQDLQQRIDSFREEAMRDMQTQQQTLVAPISKKLTDAVKTVGVEGNFIYIFDLSNPSVIYAGTGSVDATPLVKAKLGLK